MVDVDLGLYIGYRTLDKNRGKHDTPVCTRAIFTDMNSPLSRLRLVGDIEGVSYLVLLFVAMPLKYLAGMPQAVRIAGSIHGFLFVAFMVALADVWRKRGWSFRKVLLAFASSLVPFGTFALSRHIRREERNA